MVSDRKSGGAVGHQLKSPPLKFGSHDKTEKREFKRWFGASKVVDDAGKPLVVYHGTQSGGFARFDHIEGGIYVTESKNTACSFSGDGRVLRPGKDSGAGLYASYLSIKNPLVVDFHGNHYDGLIDDGTGEHWSGKTLDAVVVEAMKKGYDGVIVTNVISRGPEGSPSDGADAVTVYVAFKNEQVKFATAANSLTAGSMKLNPSSTPRRSGTRSPASRRSSSPS